MSNVSCCVHTGSLLNKWLSDRIVYQFVHHSALTTECLLKLHDRIPMVDIQHIDNIP